MIAYIIPVYPTLSETFIIREINALLESGRRIKIFSFRKEPTDHPIHKNTSIFYFNYVNTIYRKIIILFSIIKGLRVYSKFIIQALREIRFRSLLDVLKTIRHIHIGFYLATKIDPQKYSFIYGHWYNSSTICSVVHEITNIPFAVCFHANDFYREHKILPFKIEKSHAIVLNNTYNYYYFNSITNYQYSDKLKVILNCPPIIPKIFHPRKAIVGKINILSAGRIIHFKGHDILISACELLKENGYDFHVTIAGDGPNKEDIEQLVNKKNLN